MNIELLTILLIASVLLLSLVGVLLWRTGGDAAQVERIKAWALAAVGAAYNVAIDELKITGELPSGEKRRELAVAYYQTIPEDERTFSPTPSNWSLSLSIGAGRNFTNIWTRQAHDQRK
ncbi:MAG: hypothetical protein KDD89_00100 [Anaerolineales bacterium]|nr:hypothetical protein [Anaerolineales bacterium]